MKTTTISLIIISFCLVTCSQSDFNGYYNKYKNMPGITCFTKSNYSDGIICKGDTKSNFWSLYTKIDHIKYVISEDADPTIIKEMTVSLPGNKYKDLMKYDSNGVSISVKFKESGRNKNEILIIYAKSDSVFIMCLVGDFNYDEAKTCSASIDAFFHSQHIVLSD